MRFDAVQEAKGKWPGLLLMFGVPIEKGNPHSTCPICGKKKWRMDNKTGRGEWVCVCGAGDGFKLLQEVKGWDFKQSCREIKKASGAIECDLSQDKQKPIEDIKKALNALYKSSEVAKPGGSVSEYLKGRGISVLSPEVMECKTCYEYETKGRMAAMICRFLSPAGQPLTIHRTYLQEGQKAKIDSPKKMMTPAGKLDGGAIRLFKAGEILGISEGIETALSCYQQFGVPTWAAMDAGLLEKFEPPEGVKKVVVFGDCDTSFTGQKAAYTLAWKLRKKKMAVEVLIPESGDWADKLSGGGHG